MEALIKSVHKVKGGYSVTFEWTDGDAVAQDKTLDVGESVTVDEVKAAIRAFLEYKEKELSRIPELRTALIGLKIERP